jgi:hypothetical protein
MFKINILIVLVTIGMTCATQVHATKDALAELDSFSQSPYEIMMQNMKNELKKKLTPVVEKIMDAAHLQASLSEEEMQLLKAVRLGEKRLEELFNNPNYQKQEVIFMKISQEFEKKGMTEESSLAFAKRAEKECPLAFQAAALMMEVSPLKENLSILLMELLFKSLENISVEQSVK